MSATSAEGAVWIVLSDDDVEVMSSPPMFDEWPRGVSVRMGYLNGGDSRPWFGDLPERIAEEYSKRPRAETGPLRFLAFRAAFEAVLGRLPEQGGASLDDRWDTVLWDAAWKIAARAEVST